MLIAMAALIRLSPADLTNLASEAADSPMHQAVLATLDASDLLDPQGHVRIEAIRAHVESRLARVPELRRKLRRTHLFEGRALWVDDPGFRIQDHVLVATLPPPGGDIAALAFAERQMATLMDRSRPLWEIWLLEGYARDRVALMIKLHHAIADGPAMINMLAQIFDLEPLPAEQSVGAWLPAAPPTAAALVRDNLARKAASLRGAMSATAHPVRALRSATTNLRATIDELSEGRGAPRTSLNRPIGSSRRLAAMHIALADLKDVAHAEGVKLNDVFLSVVTAALRRVLIVRGEWRSGMSLHLTMAVSRRVAGDTTTSGNLAGVMVVPVPLDADHPRGLLGAVAASTARAKVKQLAVVSSGLMVFLARTGITRAYTRRQHLINVLTTNLPGPPLPLYLAGARVRDPIAIPPIAGNVTASFAALSYDGGLTLSVVADDDSWPDFDKLMDAVRSSWLELQEAVVSAPSTRFRRSAAFPATAPATAGHALR